MLLSEAFDQYRRDVIVFRNQAYKTEEHHNGTLKSLLKFVGSDIDLGTLEFEMVRAWKQDMEKRGLGAESVRVYLIKLRVVLGYCQKLGLGFLDPQLIPLPKREEKVPVWITKEQVAHLIASTKRIKNKAIFSLLYASGIRVSELCSLNITDLHDYSFTVTGKGQRTRLCFYDERSQNYIDQYLATRVDNHPALFLTDAGTRINPGAVQDTFKTARKIAGLVHCSPHTLRHTFATELLKSNVNLRYIQAFLGHRSIQTTTLYTNVVDKDLEKIYRDNHSV